MDKLDLTGLEKNGEFLIKTGQQLEKKLSSAIQMYDERLSQCAKIEACETQLKIMAGGKKK